MRLVLFITALFILPLGVSAHAFGVSHETLVDDIHIDIGYSSAAPTVGESVIFDFNLPLDETDEVYTDVWVRVNGPGGSVKLATAVYNAEFGGPRMSYVFPEAGMYTIAVRYENEGEALVKTEWSLSVLPAPVHFLEKFPLLVALVVGAFLGGALVYLGARFIRNRRHS